jgi:hypothetical protein
MNGHNLSPSRAKKANFAKEVIATCVAIAFPERMDQ